MDKETKERLTDYFDSWELCEYLRIPMDAFLEQFESEIEEALEDIEELMGVKSE
jgi:hypothetical protein